MKGRPPRYLKAKASPLRMRADIQREQVQTYNSYKRGEISREEACTRTYMLQTLNATTKDTGYDQALIRLAELEKLVKAREVRT